MRMEELQNNISIKSTDTVEKYLLNIIQEYFKDSNEAADSSREWIINEAVARLKSEMDYNSLGVLSVALPDGSVRKGDINLTLEDLGGEPKIEEKHTAFNVDFGNKVNTACEGNDPRLSDARYPLNHEHEMSDILGLEGILTTLNGRLGQAAQFEHTHENKAVLDKLVYSGTSDRIDLTIIDTIEQRADEVFEEIRQKTTQYLEEAQVEVDNINQLITELNSKIDTIKQEVLHKCDDILQESKTYIEEQFNQAKTSLETEIEEQYVKKSDIADLIAASKNVLTFAGSMKINLNQAINEVSVADPYYTVELTQDILDELTRREVGNANIYDIDFVCSIEYTKNNTRYIMPMPFLTDQDKVYKGYIHSDMQELTISGFIENIRQENNSLRILLATSSQFIEPEVLNTGNIIIEVYSKTLCDVYA